ncbi:MAG: archaeosine biosynthesis radical SAM protein RaSEA [Thermoplasmata archaeon]
MANTKPPQVGREAARPASVWTEKELVGGKLVDTGVVILNTCGCSHYRENGGCSMCGYNFGADRRPTQSDIQRQFERAAEELGHVGFLKIYTSGSFLDDAEVPADARRMIAAWAAERGCRLLFETRPEFVEPSKLEPLAAENGAIEVALGLESSNDRVLTHSINKGFKRADYERAVRTVKSVGLDVRTYVLLKPPFLTEAEAVADAISTIAYASRLTDTISLNPVNVQKGTLVERLWRQWSYRPPWLWSVLEVLQEGAKNAKKLVCDPTGGGRERGAHNCGSCDATILSSIKDYSLSQDAGRLVWPDCDCRELWREIVELERHMVGGTADLQRFFRRHGA